MSSINVYLGVIVDSYLRFVVVKDQVIGLVFYYLADGSGEWSLCVQMELM